MNYAEVCKYAQSLTQAVFDDANAQLNYFRNAQTPPADDTTLWGRLTVQEFGDNKKSLQARLGNRLFRTEGRITVQCFGTPGGDNGPLNDLFTAVKHAFQDARADAIDFVNVSPNNLGVVAGWDTINVDVDYVVHHRR